MKSRVVIGFDAEWVYDPETDSNKILSYQYAGYTDQGQWSGIIYTASTEKKDRLTLEQVIGRAIEDGRSEKLLPYKWPQQIYAAAHFSRADLSAFKNFWKIKTRFDGVAKTFATLFQPYVANYNDSSNNGHKLSIHLIDTMLLTPERGGLAVLGDLYDFPKIDLPHGAIERMDLLLEQDPEKYEQYAIRDAEISALHAWTMADFAKEHMNVDKPPSTIGSLAVKHIQRIWAEESIDSNDVLGLEEHQERIWNEKLHRYRTDRKKVPLPSVHQHEALATECFHGGRNEAYVFGFSDYDTWIDLDLAGAYTTAMAAIRLPDYEAAQTSTSVSDFTVDCLGLARVRFKFPENTIFPCLPVRTNHGLIFPLEGETHVCSPEIVLAADMGAELEILSGIIIPWKSDVRPFEVFSRSIRNMRSKHEKGSINEKIWKEIGNSLYGKLAQGLNRKRVFDTRSGDMKDLDPSQVTQPFLAAYTTSIVRAVLSELLHRLPPDKIAISATTDGFLTNAQLEELDLGGPLCTFFSELRVLVSGDPSILERKHIAQQILCWKTRGQAANEFTGFGMKPLLAKAGIKPPPEISKFGSDNELPEEAAGFEDLNRTVQASWLLRLFLDRDANTTLTQSSLVSLSDMYASDADLTPVDKEISTNMEFDWNRELIEPAESKPLALDDSSHRPYGPHFYAGSRPWRSTDEFLATRKLFDEWRHSQSGVLKTLSDWESWQQYQRTSVASKKGVRRSREGLVGQAKRVLLNAYVNGLWGFSGGDYAGMSEFLTNSGYPTKVDDLKNAKRSKTRIRDHLFPFDQSVFDFVWSVRYRFPDFEWEKIFDHDALDEARRAMADAGYENSESIAGR